MSYYKKIDGNHLYLASINSQRDAIKYMYWNNFKDNDSLIVFDGYTGKRILTEEAARAELDDLSNKDAFAIIDKGRNQMIGLIGLSNKDQINQKSNIWIKMDTTMDYDKQIDQGVNALHLMLEYCFDFMNLNSIVMEFPAFNKQSLDICKKSSMSFMAKRDQAVLLGKDLYDNLISYQCNPMIYDMETGLFEDHNRAFSEIKKLSFNNNSKMSQLLTGNNISLVMPSILREDKKKDYIHDLASFLNDPKVSIPLGNKVNWNYERSKMQLESVDYAIFKDDKLIGYINLFRKNERSRSADMEVLIGDRNEQNKGYGREAMTLFLEEEYQNGIYNSLISNIFDFNEPSLNLHQSLGYKKIGNRYEAYYAYGKLNDMQVYEMNRDVHREYVKKRR